MGARLLSWVSLSTIASRSIDQNIGLCEDKKDIKCSSVIMSLLYSLSDANDIFHWNIKGPIYEDVET